MSGRVVGGKVVIEGSDLGEGERVTIIARGEDVSFELTAQEIEALRESISEIERGEFVSREELERRLEESP